MHISNSNVDDFTHPLDFSDEVFTRWRRSVAKISPFFSLVPFHFIT